MYPTKLFPYLSTIGMVKEFETISSELKIAIEKKGATATSVAAKAGLSKQGLYDILHNRNSNPSLKAIANLCAELNLSLDELVFGGSATTSITNSAIHSAGSAIAVNGGSVSGNAALELEYCRRECEALKSALASKEQLIAHLITK